MKMKLVYMIICLSVFCAGCASEPTEQPNGQGYVFALSENRVLVLDKVGAEDLGKEWNDIFETYKGDAIWLTSDITNLQIGQYVEYWIDGPIMESYPRQATATKIIVIEMEGESE